MKKPYYKEEKVVIYNGDCLEVLQGLGDNSVDSIVTDPPYELGFMGKSWDNTGIANNVEMWSECLRVLKPGGHLLAFSGTRTYHRMASAIEDAGFEVRDMIEWVYGSGFPKSLNIGKAVDKLQGRSREDEIEFANHIKEIREKAGKTSDEWNTEFGYVAGCKWWETLRDNGYRPPNRNDYEVLKTKYGASDKFQFIVDRWYPIGEKTGTMVRSTAGFSNEQVPRPWKEKVGEEVDINALATEQAKQWEGWGTALKPAHEPICMARKPLAEKTVAENCLKWGVGGINIDESRVKKEEGDRTEYGVNGITRKTGNVFGKQYGEIEFDGTQGRFPANLIHDNGEEVRECFPNESERFFKSIIYQAKASKSERNKGREGLEEKPVAWGNQAKAELKRGNLDFKADGDATKHNKVEMRINNHPTVKPIALTEYLIKMVTPKGGVVLDPFMGSGSTGVASKQGLYSFVGIDLEQEYCKIAIARIGAVENRLL